ncbi:beta-N-acetylhexosaminidase [Catalinimonas alkaloidigena]|nr:family 20 glycosylhydrolase [Catalinimonas alkaloidigena]
MNVPHCLVTLALVVVSTIAVHAQAPSVAIIPQPVSLEKGQGTFPLVSATSIVVPSGQPDVQKIGTYLSDEIQPATGYQLKVTETLSPSAIVLTLNAQPDAALGEEGYRLEATAQQITIAANQPAGLFYGVQSLLQLLPKEIESDTKAEGVEWAIPAVTITDAPRFGWRGIMLDVSRHFYTQEEVKAFIDHIARYKFNRFHWHLTDDQGWRVEIKSLPKLTSVGAWRVPRVGRWGNHAPPAKGEKATDGGFYTQDDIREVVQYAKDRYIEILPEIDVPGHSMAAIAAYPELACTEDPNAMVNPGSKFSTWHGNGKFTMHIDNTLDPSEEDTYTFMDKVMTEVAQLFPFEYIHMGGDECYKGYWEKDASCQALMKQKGMKSAEELQSYFSKRVHDIITSKGKKTIGWDEILEGGLPKGAAVMSWRGMKGGIEAAHLGAPVVMSPSPMAYLDLYQGDPSVEPPTYSMARLKDSYAWDPVPEGVKSSLILGSQGNVWTEQLAAPSQLQYMMYPRAFAIAEIGWTAKNQKSWEGFVPRVEQHMARFDEAGINYARSIYDAIIQVKKNPAGNLVVTLSTEVPGVDLYYTLDNSLPNQYYNPYKEPIVVPKGVDLFRVISYRNGEVAGKMISLTAEELAKRVKK